LRKVILKEILPMNSIPFHSIYLIDGETGVEYVSKNYSENKYDVNVITGMFKALETFINHLAYSENYEHLQEINFKGLRIVYERYNPAFGKKSLLCVGISKKEEDAMIEHAFLQKIVIDFYNVYEPVIQHFKGDVMPFQCFFNRLEEYQYNWNSDQKDPTFQGYNSPQIVKTQAFPEFHGFQRITD